MTSTPTLAELRETAVPFRIRLTEKFRGVTVREGWLIQGPAGWGEFAPFDDYPPQLAARWLQAAVDAAWAPPLPLQRAAVAVNAIIPATTVAHTAELVRAAVGRGCSTMKVKVATDDTASDVAVVAAVRATLDECLGESAGRIRLDANAGWTLGQARELLPQLIDAARDVEYVEQPCADLDDCAEIRSLGLVPVAIDEGLRLASDLEDDALWSRLRDAADVLIVKPIPLGGVTQVLAVADRAQVPVVVSSSLDSSIGLMYAVRAAASLPELPFACGLGTGALLADDLVTDTVLPQDGMIAVRDISPDPQLLSQHRIGADDPRHDYWQRRLSEATAHLMAFGSVEP